MVNAIRQTRYSEELSELAADSGWRSLHGHSLLGHRKLEAWGLRVGGLMHSSCHGCCLLHVTTCDAASWCWGFRD